jgi:sarcosine oxidase
VSSAQEGEMVEMVEHVDVVVVGGGAMGLSAAWWLAPQARVVVVERFEPRHERGASHGDERMFRYLYPDGTYVRLAVDSEEGWRRLEHDAGRPLLHRAGSLLHGRDAELDHVARVAVDCGVDVEQISPVEALARWPGMHFTGDVVVQPRAGWIEAAATVQSLAVLATAAGADIRFGTQVTGIDAGDDGVLVHADGATVQADVVVVAGGAWTSGLLPEVTLPPLVTTEEHVFFFEPRRPLPDAGITSFLHEDEITVYGLPGPSGLVKVGEHHSGAVVTGDDRSFTTGPERIARMEGYVAEWLPGLVPTTLRTSTCLYTSTATLDFVLDRVGPLVVGAGFAGHGFKFVPEIGRRLADLATGAAPPDPRFSLEWHATRHPAPSLRLS